MSACKDAERDVLLRQLAGPPSACKHFLFRVNIIKFNISNRGH